MGWGEFPPPVPTWCSGRAGAKSVPSLPSMSPPGHYILRLGRALVLPLQETPSYRSWDFCPPRLPCLPPSPTPLLLWRAGFGGAPPVNPLPVSSCTTGRAPATHLLEIYVEVACKNQLRPPQPLSLCHLHVLNCCVVDRCQVTSDNVPAPLPRLQMTCNDVHVELAYRLNCKGRGVLIEKRDAAVVLAWRQTSQQPCNRPISSFICHMSVLSPERPPYPHWIASST